jgi:hypothetical protein
MAKNKVSEWSATAANNTDIGGINIAEGCAPSGINNAIREMMAQVKDMQSGTDADNFTVGGNLNVSGNVSVTGSVSLTTKLSADNGGTGLSSLAAGDIIYGSATNTFSKLTGPATTGSVLLSGSVAPSWGKVPMATHVSGTLPVANGGTGATSLASKSVLIGNDTSAVSAVAPSTSGNVLASNGTDWASTALSSLDVFAKSLSENGYQKLPGGLIIQWGKVAVTTSTTTVTFPLAFTTACYSVICTPYLLNDTGGIDYAPAVKTLPTTTTVAFSTIATTMDSLFWIAIGS